MSGLNPLLAIQRIDKELSFLHDKKFTKTTLAEIHRLLERRWVLMQERDNDSSKQNPST